LQAALTAVAIDMATQPMEAKIQGGDDPHADLRMQVVRLINQRRMVDADFAAEMGQLRRAAGAAKLSKATAQERVRRRVLRKLHPKLSKLAQDEPRHAQGRRQAEKSPSNHKKSHKA
jgi:hypothetical protein